MIAQPFSVSAIDSRNDFGCDTIECQSIPVFENIFSTDAIGGEDSLKENIIPDQGFAEEDSAGGPEYFYYGGTTYAISNSSYQDNVHSGSYSGYLANKGTLQSTGYAYNYRSFASILLNYSVTLDFWYNPYGNPDILAGGEIYAYVQCYTGSTWPTLYYYFSRDSPLSTNGTNGFYDMRSGLSSWLHFDRNITRDYEEAIGPVTPTTMIQGVYFYARSPSGSPTGYTELIIDDVSLTNDTGYEFLQNGDFEFGNGNYWYTYSNGPSSSEITYNDFTEGNSALNITAKSYFDDSTSYCYTRRNIYVGSNYYYKSFQAVQPEDVMINFDWKYSDVENGGDSQYAYFRIFAQNSTLTYNLYFYLGHDSDNYVNTNSTSSGQIIRYYNASGFGTRDSWNHFTLDLYELSVIENILEIPIRQVEFYLYSGNQQNATTQLLVDNFDLTTYPTGDPSFEMDFAWNQNDPVIAWDNSGNHLYTNITSDAHTGNYAANITSHNSYGISQVSRNLYLPIDNNLYADFWWKLEHITDTDGDYSEIYFVLNGSYTLHYLLGKSSITYLGNSSNNVFFTVENYNTTGTWYNLVRDIAADAQAAFTRSDWVLTDIQLASYCYAAGGKVITLFDDIHFARDTTPPAINSVTVLNTPTYYDNAVIEIVANDILNPVSEVILTYQHNSIWYPVLATEISENNFVAEIPYYEYNTDIEFYVEAFDTFGNNNTADNSGSNYSYTIADDVDPTLTIFGPAENETLSDQVIFYIGCNDVGSDVNQITIEIDDSELYTGVLIESIILDTRLYDDGDHTLSFEAEDIAGNSILVEKDITISNPTPDLITFGVDQNDTLTGQVTLYIEGLEDGRDISQLSIKLGDTELYNGSFIDVFVIDSTQHKNGNYKLTFIVKDTGGNTLLYEKTISIDNPAPVLVILGNYFNWGTLIGAGVIALGFGIFFLVRFIKNKKAA